ncbi:MAG TPA: alpha-ketoglutarate-dependent dioxygenase AlkB [Chitinophagaceae bacterium]|nr:alpha-ketoglutarate-dependent dioxygenase AlkB [Chitinophagaceae bacterium]
MSSLFPIEYVYPPGFSYYPDFLSDDEEFTFIEAIKKVELHSLVFQGFVAKRRTASFGYDYNFDRRTIAKGKPIPPDFIPLVERVANKLLIAPEKFAELLLTEYPIGSVINWHRDAPPFDIIAGISLNADCIFRLRPHDKTKQSRSSIISLLVQRRSLYVIKGEARSDWQHSISPVKQVRYSITLRTLTQRP